MGTDKKQALKQHLAAVLLPLAVWGGLLLRPVLALREGKELRLAVLPVDPRSWAYGDYVALSYEAEEQPWERSAFDAASAPGGTCWVEMGPPGRDGLSRPLRLLREPGENPCLKARGRPFRGGKVLLRYALPRRFYVREDTGRPFEEAARKGRLAAVFRVRGKTVLLDRLETLPKP